MRLLHSATELGRHPGVCLAIGFFDGVHLGHQQVIRQAVEDANRLEGTSVALTFDRHPKSVIAPDRVPPLIYSLPQRLRAISAMGVDTTLLLKFDEPFSRQSGEEFVRSLLSGLRKVFSICVGSTFTFGHKRSGNVPLLQRLGQELDFQVHGLAAVSVAGKPVSSTRIREAILAGRLDPASQMLGRLYALAGAVVPGDGIGRELGFPTANLAVAGRAVPPKGVYAAHVLAEGAAHRAVVNIGVRPTLGLPTPALRVEAHLLDFSGDLAGEELELLFVQRLRDEQRFPSRGALREQITKDILCARQLFSHP